MIRMLTLALVLLVSGCAGHPPPDFESGEALRSLTLSPASLGRSLSLSQRATGRLGDNVYRMRFELDISPARLAIVGLSPLGVTLFTIVQEKGAIDVESIVKGEVEFDPRYTLSDVYLAYWPAAVLHTALERIRFRLEDSPDGTSRRVRGSNGEVIVEITYSLDRRKPGDIIIRHFDIPYSLRIETVDARESG